MTATLASGPDFLYQRCWPLPRLRGDIRVEREIREYIIESFDDYCALIEAEIGSLPQAYLALSEPDRRSVREEVREGLLRFESNGRLLMSIEMLIGKGRA